jgi:hypothetical protein
MIAVAPAQKGHADPRSVTDRLSLNERPGAVPIADGVDMAHKQEFSITRL